MFKILCSLATFLVLSGALSADQNNNGYHNGSYNQRMDSSEGTTIRIMPDGSKIIRTNDGTMIQKVPDGTKIINKPDGTAVEVRPDGSKRIHRPDGSTVETDSDD